MTLTTIVLFDLVLLVVLAQVAYRWTCRATLRFLSFLLASAHSQPGVAFGTVDGAGFSVPLVTGGGVGGTSATNEDDFVPGHRSVYVARAIRQQQQHLNELPRRDWIAVTEPRQRLEVPVHPDIFGTVRALLPQIAHTPIGHRLVRMMNGAASIIGTRQLPVPQRPPSLDLSRISSLPQELVTYILFMSASPSLAPDEPPSSPTNILLLSKHYRDLVLPKLYHTVSLHTPYAFRHFRLTLALHNPSLGKLVKYLQIGSSQFDSSGYLPGQLAEHGPLAVGIEQLLLATPNLQELAIDLFSLAALHTGTASRLERGCQPPKLCTELSTIPYLSLPTFEDLQELDLLVFGMDRQTAIELRVALPRLKRLKLRFVCRRREQVFSSTNDMDDFVEAVQVLRAWPDGDVCARTQLESLEIFVWPEAVEEIRGKMTEQANQDVTRLHLELDRSYLLGPRRGAHVLWRKDRAHAAWA